jgi:hypothetical protein
LHHGGVVPGDRVEAGRRRGEVAVGDAAGEPVPDGGVHVAPQAGQELADRVVLHGAGRRGGLLAAGVLGPGRPAVHVLADGPKVLAELEARATVGKLALRP